jgi:predicted O-methyltransferase YrrM
MAANEVPEPLAQYCRAIGPLPDDVLSSMDAKAEREGFPHVGPEVGGWLAMLARMADAERVFEFGSGFGYSAYWFARELPADGEVVLTEIDADEFDEARDFLERGGLADRARFEHGDAIDIVDSYDGPFDVVLVDNEKHRYAEAFEAVRGKLAPGGIVAADNAVAGGSIEMTDLLAHFEGESVAMNESTRGMAEYLETVNEDPAFETVLLPLGEGVAVSHRQH